MEIWGPLSVIIALIPIFNNIIIRKSKIRKRLRESQEEFVSKLETELRLYITRGKIENKLRNALTSTTKIKENIIVYLPNVFVITGIGWVGKTSLAKNLYRYLYNII